MGLWVPHRIYGSNLVTGRPTAFQKHCSRNWKHVKLTSSSLQDILIIDIWICIHLTYELDTFLLLLLISQKFLQKIHWDVLIRLYCWWVNIGSSNGLMPNGTKPLADLMLTKSIITPAGGNESIYLKISNIRCIKTPKLKCFSSHLAVVFAQSIEARC